jgi:EmrB/QacA subfamily drug resistance transporter
MKSGRQTSNRTIVLIVSTAAAFLTPFMSSSLNLALPAVGDEFKISAVVQGWVATSYILAVAVFLIPFGKLADQRGRKKIFGWGSLIYALGSGLSAGSFSVFVLLASRVVQGLGGAMILGTGVAMLTSAYPQGERGRVLGINVSSTYLGLSLGPVLGGFLTHYLGWRSIFWINAFLGLFVFALSAAFLKEERAEARKGKFDAAGSIVLGLALVSLMLGLSRLPQTTAVLLVLAGLAGIAGFILLEKTVRNPVLDMRLFQGNPVFAYSNLAALINYCATFAVGFLLSFYLQFIKGMSPQNAGLILVAQPAVMAIFSPLAGRLSDRHEPRLLASAGMAVSAAGLGLLAFLARTTSLGFVGMSLAVLGLGFALFSSPNTNAVMSSVEKSFFGLASATLGTMRMTGQMLSMGAAMLIFALYLGTARITPEVFPQFLTALRTAFLFFAALCLVGVFASLKRGKMR